MLIVLRLISLKVDNSNVNNSASSSIHNDSFIGLNKRDSAKIQTTFNFDLIKANNKLKNFPHYVFEDVNVPEPFPLRNFPIMVRPTTNLKESTNFNCLSNLLDSTNFDFSKFDKLRLQQIRSTDRSTESTDSIKLRQIRQNFDRL
ncbi:hypothetical protein CDAR_87901 [Caerostris darwini]|uniref:Uncharacterized protein n=1 Tax=Caerostris darwini TaxID=1538125 RepID=A0AAV4S4E9_9ARAC|nr:hypothetical protein CDAR_87901 [Caerostris darwini]